MKYDPSYHRAIWPEYPGDSRNQGDKAEDIPASPQQDDASGSMGMTLRDYFAAQAMQGAIASLKEGEELNLEHLAKWAYQVADAMLAAREAK